MTQRYVHTLVPGCTSPGSAPGETISCNDISEMPPVLSEHDSTGDLVSLLLSLQDCQGTASARLTSCLKWYLTKCVIVFYYDNVCFYCISTFRTGLYVSFFVCGGLHNHSSIRLWVVRISRTVVTVQLTVCMKQISHSLIYESNTLS